MIFSRGIPLSVVFAAMYGCAGGVAGPAPESAALTVDRLQAATFNGIFDEPVTLVDGQYEGEPYTSGTASRPIVRLIPGVIATGDVTGDGTDEAVVVLAHNSGGSGVFMYLAVMQETRRGPENIATVMLGDRVKVIAIEIKDGKIAAEKQAARTRAGRVRGHLVWGHETRSFSECETGREAWVFNESGNELTAVYDELTAAPYQPMFVEVRGVWEEAPTEGFGADYGEALRITELLRAENEGFGCRLDLGSVLFVASGNEPFWRLQIREDGVALRTIDEAEETVFRAPEQSEYAGLVTYYSSNTRDAEIRITLERRRCLDSMSGARYAWAATVEIEGQRLQGCAAEGI
jgi:uncharacterized membrane protein